MRTTIRNARARDRQERCLTLSFVSCAEKLRVNNDVDIVDTQRPGVITPPSIAKLHTLPPHESTRSSLPTASGQIHCRSRRLPPVLNINNISHQTQHRLAKWQPCTRNTVKSLPLLSLLAAQQALHRSGTPKRLCTTRRRCQSTFQDGRQLATLANAAYMRTGRFRSSRRCFSRASITLGSPCM